MVWVEDEHEGMWRPKRWRNQWGMRHGPALMLKEKKDEDATGWGYIIDSLSDCPCLIGWPSTFFDRNASTPLRHGNVAGHKTYIIWVSDTHIEWVLWSIPIPNAAKTWAGLLHALGQNSTLKSKNSVARWNLISRKKAVPDENDQTMKIE
jgi:hypothetical protein